MDAVPQKLGAGQRIVRAAAGNPLAWYESYSAGLKSQTNALPRLEGPILFTDQFSAR